MQASAPWLLLQGSASLFVACADKTIRSFLCHHGVHADEPVRPSAVPKGSRSTTSLWLSSRTSSLYHQGFPADVTAMACSGWLLAGGCADGSVGLMAASLAASKARFAAFSSKHAGAVNHCIIRLSCSAGNLPLQQQARPGAPSVENGASHAYVVSYRCSITAGQHVLLPKHSRDVSLIVHT